MTRLRHARSAHHERKWPGKARPFHDRSRPPYVFFSATRNSASVLALTSSSETPDRKSTRLNSSHTIISYAVFCLKKKKKERHDVQVPARGALGRAPSR